MALLNRANIHTLNGSEGLIRYRRKDGTTLPLNTRVFLLYSLDNHRLYLSTIE